MAPWAYREMEEEFNRRQLSGEPCDDLVRIMSSVLSSTGFLVDARYPTRLRIVIQDEAA